MLKKIFFALFFYTFFSCSNVVFAETNKKIIYIPLDNRPVSLDYVVQTINFAGENLIIPPETLLANNNHLGNPDELMHWLIKNCTRADYAVISTDSLIYGGLVASRTHNEPLNVLLKRAQALNIIRQTNPNLKIYAFSTLMRTPRKSNKFIEPPYYEYYGPDIFRLTALLDKETTLGLTALEIAEKNNLLLIIPEEFLSDWFSRRKKNLTIHNYLLDLYTNKAFHFYTIGKDDNAPYSQTHFEAKQLLKTLPQNIPANFKIIAGVDQLGLMLITRAINQNKKFSPAVFVQYTDGAGATTLPAYSDQHLYSSVEDQINLVNAQQTFALEEADIVLVINTPFDGVTLDASNLKNTLVASLPTLKLVDKTKYFMTLQKKVAIADVAFANGADNSFIFELNRAQLCQNLNAYSGWNTADNSIGYALAQGILANHMSSEQKNLLLKIRLVDDWLYQANVRPKIVNRFFKNTPHEQYNLGSETTKINSVISDDLIYKTKDYSIFQNFKFKTALPWQRLFEINVQPLA